ncbi:MAG: hypothetical protein ABR907_14300, partial [Terracidiphilus sp.]
PRCWQEAGPRLLKKIQLKENITSYGKPRLRGPAYWPLISAKELIAHEQATKNSAKPPRPNFGQQSLTR